jgi:hypothetical protein
MIEAFMKTFAINALEPDWWVKEIDGRFKNREPKDRSTLPLHEIVWEFKKKIEIDRSGINSEEMVNLAEKIKFLSQEKVEYYKSTRFGFIKQIFSFLRNVICIGRFNSSGRLGLKLSQSFLSESPAKEFQQTPLSPRKKLTEVEEFSSDPMTDLDIVRNEIKIANHDKDQPRTLSHEVEQGNVIEKVLTSEYLEMMTAKYLDAIDEDKILDESIKQGAKQYIFDWEQTGDIEEINDNFEYEEDVDEFYDAREFFDDHPVKENPKVSITDQPSTGPEQDLKEDLLMDVQKISDPHLSVKVSPEPSLPISLTPKDEMLNTVKVIWKYASSVECECIKLILTMLMKSATIEQWKATDKHNEYQLDLKNEMLGKSADLPIGKIVIKQKMKVAFSEERNPETERYRQVITFPDKGICCRMGVGWLSKDIPVYRIVVEELENQVWCSVETMGKNTPEQSTDFILSYLYDLDWS